MATNKKSNGSVENKNTTEVEYKSYVKDVLLKYN